MPDQNNPEQESIFQEITQGKDQQNEELLVGIIDTNGKVRSLKALPTNTLSSFEAMINQFPDAKINKSTKSTRRRVSIPAITSGHKTPLPGTDSFLVLTESFGPQIAKQPSLWPEGEGFDLLTPTGSLRIEGQTLTENQLLQQYVARDLGPDGLKHLTGLVDVYLFITKGQDQKKDIEVTAKQVLQRIGREGHADDRDEQEKLLNTALYLASTYVTVYSSHQKRTSPLIIIESLIEDQDGTITLKYHLGEETFYSIFGNQPQKYTLPTPQIIGYHSGKSQHELLLTFYLGNRLAIGKGKCSMYFTTLCVQSALYTSEQLAAGEKNRMRDAQQVIYALERMESDELIRREAHPDIDTVLAANICLDNLDGKTAKRTIAPTTYQRIKPLLRALKGSDKKNLNAKRRISLQRLLDFDSSREQIPEETPEYCTRISFQMGPLLQQETIQELPTD
ncbi:MAG TPA: hypothetical protein VL461_15715 [Dictyobacter sp.]|nr:hypothetical protein [Dictyobacter sp.]